MTFKAILFCLFLYICLVWVGASYFYSGAKLEQTGLLWTGAGLAAVLCLMVLSRLFGWWRIWRSKAAAKPKRAAAPTPAMHEDEAALAALLKEANAALEKVETGAGKREGDPVSRLPVYLLVGPEGSGKTSTFLNAGLEPQLLAGQTTGFNPVTPTRAGNIWLAKGQIFIELGGRSFSGDAERWGRLLRILQAKRSLTKWQRLWKEPGAGLDLRGALAFCDAKEFNAPASPQARERFERQCSEWQERLSAIAEVFGVECPVYVVVSKCDSIPYFSDYFRRLAESETGQVLGCALPKDGARANSSAEADTKKLTRTFNALFHSLADKRITQLAHEPDATKRPAIYEFPRELKRVRPALIQFLTAVFRPHPLRSSLELRGYYFSATGERESLPALGDSRVQWTEQSVNLEATTLFRAEASHILRGGGELSGLASRGGVGRPGGGGMLLRKWLFVSELFQTVLPQKQPAQRMTHGSSRFELYRQAACLAVCAMCLILCCVFVQSWIGNLHLLHSLRSGDAKGMAAAGTIPTRAELQSLEDLRVQLSELAAYKQDGPPLSLRWGLYSGNGILEPMRTVYFRRFQALLLDPLNAAMVSRLRSLPGTAGSGGPAYNPVFRLLKAHLMISSGVCHIDPGFAAGTLKSVREESMAGQDAAWQSLADRQIDFYANELRSGNPCRLGEDAAARDRARQYLMNSQGVDRIYNGMLVAAEKAFPKPQRLSELAPNYQQVLSGPGDVEGVFTRDGWAFVEKASKNGSSMASGDACVLGDGDGSNGERKHDLETERAIQRMFLRDYVERWRKYVGSFSVVRDSGPGDAARRLDILSDHKSPLLALLVLVSNQTNFPVSVAEPEGFERVKPVVKRIFPILGSATVLKKAAEPAGMATDGMSVQADITEAFQPVHWVVPAGSETWVSDKNSAYVDALAGLGHSMQEIARSGATPDAAVFQAASQSYDKALDAARQIARGFEPLGVGGLDVTVERLLEAPIRQTQGFIITDLDSAAAGKVNGQLRAACEHIKGTLRKYPFQASGPDATLEELAGWFAPGNGAIWKFEGQSLGDFAVKEGIRWKSKDPAKKPQITPEMLEFLNRSQTIADAFYPGGAAQPAFTYTLRPKLDASYKDAVLELEIDGQTYVWNSSLQKQFSWPTGPGAKETGVRGRIKMGSVSFPFASRGGQWAMFRMMGDAEPRPVGSRQVEWKYLRSGDGRTEAITSPVRLEFVEFPGGVDLFNPKFMEDLRCPVKAVQ